jgi:hypothetical protein
MPPYRLVPKLPNGELERALGPDPGQGELGRMLGPQRGDGLILDDGGLARIIDVVQEGDDLVLEEEGGEA